MKKSFTMFAEKPHLSSALTIRKCLVCTYRVCVYCSRGEFSNAAGTLPFIHIFFLFFIGKIGLYTQDAYDYSSRTNR